MKPDPLGLLARPDKWQLGGGSRLLWAPPFPQWLGAPGFWDRAQYYNHDLGPLFTWSLLMGDETIPLTAWERKWDPSKLVTKFRAEGAPLSVAETKLLLPGDVFASLLEIANRSRSPLTITIAAWTMQRHDPPAEETRAVGADREELHFMKRLAPAGREPAVIACAFGMRPAGARVRVRPSERAAVEPRWELSPFADGPRIPPFNGDPPSGHLYAALTTTLKIPAGRRKQAAAFFAAAPSKAEASSALRRALDDSDPCAASERQWEEYFSTVPRLTAGDPLVEHAYWHRWYNLKLLALGGGEGNYPSPAVCEGIGVFRAPIAYSAFAQMLETRWRHEPDTARGIFANFAASQRPDGVIRGYLEPAGIRRDAAGDELFYFADWGKALASLEAVHPSREFLGQAYETLSRYAGAFDRQRDAEGSGLYDVVNQYETGQEYSRRYLAVDPEADRDRWGSQFRLKGIDATVYQYSLKEVLASAARRLGRESERETWRKGAERIAAAVRERMWDPQAGMFFDVNPATGRRTGVKAAVCFYPYATAIAGAEHLAGFKRHLLNPAEFWTPFPVPSLSRDDPMFSAEGIWRGVRRNCPWNGRVWPMTNCHVAEALAACSSRFDDDEVRDAAAGFFRKFLAMMTFGGDPRLPNSFEHYHPMTGAPSRYRGVDDYLHSWIADLILRFAGGLCVEEDAVVVAPLPGLGDVRVEGLFIRGAEFSVRVKGREFSVRIGGGREVRARLGERLRFTQSEEGTWKSG